MFSTIGNDECANADTHAARWDPSGRRDAQLADSLASDCDLERNATPLKQKTPGGQFPTLGRTPGNSGFAQLWER